LTQDLITGLLHERIAAARQTLVEAGFRPDDAAVDVDVLARHVLGWDRAQLLARVRDSAPAGFAEPFRALVTRRARREPVALIIGHREFWGLDFSVTGETLVPRPESELIVEEALRRLPETEGSTVLDVGTGSGCLAIAIAHQRQAANVVATDLSPDALAVASMNARAHGVERRVHFVCADLTEGLTIRADLIVANPPYVPEQSARSLSPDVVQYEPAVALFGGADGLRVTRRLLQEAPARLAPGGALVMEFGDGQEEAVRDAADRAGWQVDGMLHDLQGIARTSILRR